MSNRSKIIGVVFIVAMILATTSLLILLFNPFRTLPSVRVVNANWALSVGGYTLNLEVETTDRIQLVSIDVGGKIYRVAYDILPPRTNLTIPLPISSPEEYITLHYDILSPVKVYAAVRKHTFDVEVASGRGTFFIFGETPSKSVVAVTQIPEEPSVAILISWRRYAEYVSVFKDFFQKTNITVVSVPGPDAVEVMDMYRTLVFIEVFPEPSLLNDLVRRGKTVILHSYDFAPGEYRIKIANNTVVEERITEDPEVNYFGIRCVKKYYSMNLRSDVDLINKMKEWVGALDGSYAVMVSPHYMIFHDVYVKNEFGDVYLGRTVKGFYYSSINAKYLLMLVISGFFETKGRITTTLFELQPFKGLKILETPPTQPALIMIYTEKYGIAQKVVRPPPITYVDKGGAISLSIGIDKYGKTVWNRTANIKVVEVSYDGSVIDVKVDRELTLPTIVDLPSSNYTAYLIYIDNKLTYVLADESATAKPHITISNSEICELFYLTVARHDSINTPLYLYINGRRISILYPKQSYTTSSCSPGYYLVEVRNVYGDLITSKTFKISRIYEQPLFIFSILMSISVAFTTYWAVRRRAEKDVDYVTLILYKLPDKKDVTLTDEGIIDVVNKYYVRRKIFPTIRDVAEYIYRRYPVMKVITDFFTVLKTTLERRKSVKIYSRYLPELDDTLSIIGYGKISTLISDFYTHAIFEVMKKFGGSPVPKEYLKDVIDVDCALLIGENLILLTYVTDSTNNLDAEIRNAIDRAFTSFTLIRRLKLPFRPIGFAIVVEPKYVNLINRYIDEILSGNRDIASKLLRDMSLFQRITEASKDAWLGRYIMVAVPVTRLAPLMAFVKMRTPKLCNHYYRFAPFTHEL